MAALSFQRRLQGLAIFAAVVLVSTYLLLNRVPEGPHSRWSTWSFPWSSRRKYDWAHRTMQYPIAEIDVVQLPAGTPRQLPGIQHDFSKDPKDDAREEKLAQRRESIQNTLRKCWQSYKQFAWRYDELKPLSLKGTDTFGGWGATLVDSLDTLWITGLREEFSDAIEAVVAINWDDSKDTWCSLFETNIRYLGGLLSAYELSHDERLLGKALELGYMLYAAFDTWNHMPVNSFNFAKAKAGKLVPDTKEGFASLATLSMEFTKLSQLTGDMRFYSAIDRIKLELNKTQDTAKLPGMWPIYIDLKNGFLADGNTFSLGAQADSGYEYLPKMYALLGGLDELYATMHKKAMETAKNHLLFRAMIPDAGFLEGRPDVLFSGDVLSNGKIIDLVPRIQHLGCFAGGLFALGGKLFGLDEHVKIGEQLTRGCVWAYSAFPSDIMPEVATLIPCKTENLVQCKWDEERWKKEKDLRIPKGFHQVRDARYLLRPEAVESLFVLYRITGKRELQDMAWAMFQAIQNATETKFGHSSVADVRGVPAEKTDSMESFWIAETLKYLYLIFSEPDIISLDDYVFNTEAHPFRIPKQGNETSKTPTKPKKTGTAA